MTSYRILHRELVSMKTLIFTGAAIACIASAVLTLAQSVAPVVDLGYVKYTGTYNATTGINYYRGIRYAEPPTGDKRWRNPVPIESNNPYNGSTIQLSGFPPICYQGNPGFPSTLTDLASEDCLALDVLVPAKKQTKPLSVVVMIHGGGYTAGSPTQYLQGDSLVYRSNGSVIYVEIQYRLGMLGFLAGSEIKKNGDLNTGLLDQRLALIWIKKHISVFGGDPTKITIDGGSAGGASVTLHMMAYGGQQQVPFRSAIADFPWWQSFKPESYQEEQYQNVLKQSNCSSLDCLRGLPTDKIKELCESTQAKFKDSNSTKYAHGDFYYGPVVDGSFLRELPSEAFLSGRFARVPLLIDRESDEGNIFSDPNESVQELPHDLNSIFFNPPQSFLNNLNRLYPPSAYNNSVFDRRKRIFGDDYINCPTQVVATASARVGRNSSAVFKYISYASQGLHSSIYQYIFTENVNGPFGANDTLGLFLQDYYISFIKYQDPNVAKNSAAPSFPSYASGYKVLIVSDTDIKIAKDLDQREACYFYAHHPSYTMN